MQAGVLATIPPPSPAFNFIAACRALYYLVQGKPFEYAIMAVIVANSALMATAFYGRPDEMDRVVEVINYVFTGMYVLEFVLKVGGGDREVVRERGVCLAAAGVQ